MPKRMVTIYIEEEMVKLIDKLRKFHPNLPKELGIDSEVKGNLIPSRGAIIEACVKYVYEKMLKPHKHY